MSLKAAAHILKEIAAIEDVEQRKEALRKAAIERNPIALIVQYAYHPDMIFDLPEGDVPESVVAPSYEISPNESYRLLRHFKTWTVDNHQTSKRKKEETFLRVLNLIYAEDVPVYIGIKDKKLPWATLDEAFCKWALPELFPLEEKPVPAPAQSQEPVNPEQPVKRKRGRPRKVKPVEG